MEVGGQRDQFSARTTINGWLPIHQQNRGGNLTRGALPASANGHRDQGDCGDPKDQGQTALVPRRSFVAWLVARSHIWIAMAVVGIGSGARQTNRHPVMENRAHARRFFWRLRRRLGRRRIICDRKRTRRLLILAEGIKSETCHGEESKQHALRCNRYVHNKYLEIPEFDGHCRNRVVPGKLFRGRNGDFFGSARFGRGRCHGKGTWQTGRADVDTGFA